jgi:hypothetical protein
MCTRLLLRPSIVAVGFIAVVGLLFLWLPEPAAALDTQFAPPPLNGIAFNAHELSWAISNVALLDSSHPFGHWESASFTPSAYDSDLNGTAGAPAIGGLSTADRSEYPWQALISIEFPGGTI